MTATVLFSRLVRPGLGDLVQRNIFLNQLRRDRPDEAVVWVLGAGVEASAVQRELVQNHSYADEVLFCPDAEDGDVAAMDRFRESLAGRGFSRCVVDPASIGLGAPDAASAGIAVRIAVATGSPHDQMITAPMQVEAGRVLGLHDFAVALARAVGTSAPAPDQTLPRLPFRGEPVPDWASDRPLVGIHPGGAVGWNRRWPEMRFADLAVRVAGEYGATIVLLGGAEDRADLERLRATVLDRHPSGTVHLAAGLPLNLLANVIDRMDLLIGNDSVLAHLAAALATPTVVAYGPTSTDLVIGPVYPVHRGVHRNFACRDQPLAAGLPGEEDEDAGQCDLGCACFYNGPQTPSPYCLVAITVLDMWSAVQAQMTAAGIR